jgi:hypothetical protein
MGTHITILEFILISVGSLFSYAFIKAVYDTYLKPFYQTYLKRK